MILKRACLLGLEPPSKYAPSDWCAELPFIVPPPHFIKDRSEGFHSVESPGFHGSRRDVQLQCCLANGEPLIVEGHQNLAVFVTQA